MTMNVHFIVPNKESNDAHFFPFLLMLSEIVSCIIKNLFTILISHLNLQAFFTFFLFFSCENYRVMAFQIPSQFKSYLRGSMLRDM